MSYLEEYKQQGFILIKNFFDVSIVLNVKNQMVELFEQITQSKFKCDQDIINLYNTNFKNFLGWTTLCHSIIDLHNLCGHKKIIDILKQLKLNTPIENMKPSLFFSCESIAKHTSYWKTAPHQDWPFTRGSLNGVTLWLPFVDVTTELGPLELAQNTHLEGELESTITNFSEIGTSMSLVREDFNYTSLPMNIGDIVIFNYFTVHRSGTNIFKDKIRWSTHFRYDDASEPTFIKRGYPIFQKEVRNNDCKLEEGFPSVQQINNLFV